MYKLYIKIREPIFFIILNQMLGIIKFKTKLLQHFNCLTYSNSDQFSRLYVVFKKFLFSFEKKLGKRNPKLFCQ